MPCGNVWVASFDVRVPSGYQYMCWPDGAQGGENVPPDTGGGGGSGGGGSVGGSSSVPTGTQIPGPLFDPGSGDGTVVVAGTDTDIAPSAGITANPGWNSGAHSLTSLPADWGGMISFDLPDVQGARQGGVAVGLAPVTDLPTVGRSGYAHLRYGLVVTADDVQVIHGGVVVLEVAYATVRAAREAGVSTDLVSALMYGDFVKWIVNGITLFAGSFSMPGEYALDATLFLAFDSVDNPKFEAGEWGAVEDGSLNGVTSAFDMTADASPPTSLQIPMQAFAAQFSDEVVWNLFGGMRGFSFESGEGEGIAGVLGPFSMVAADIENYTPLVGAMKPFGMAAGMGPAGEGVRYSVLLASASRFGMSMTFPPTARVEGVMSAFEMRASSQATYAELRAPMRGFRLAAYGGEMTPLVQILEGVGARMPVFQSTYIALMFIERVDGTTSAVASATVTAEAMSQITAADATSYTATLLDSAAELIGAGERLIVMARRVTGGGLVDEGEAWVVNTRSNATTRYGQYGFNSFAVVGGRQFGARTDGVYLLQGTSDAGAPITSGVSLGKHDFGTQALKNLPAVHAGVSSTGALFLKVGDGIDEHTYRARRNDDRMRTQRFDPGRGLRSSYFTFELTSESDAFELDSVQFTVLSSQRRI